MSVKIKFNVPGFYELRSEPGVTNLLETKAQEVCDKANAMGHGTYVVGSQQGMRRPQGRWRASVVTADARAMVNNAKNNTLLKALGGGAFGVYTRKDGSTRLATRAQADVWGGRWDEL